MFKKLLPVSLALGVSAALAASVTVNVNDTKQSVVGFGGGSVYYQNWLANLSKDDQKDLFDTAFTGLNLSFLRIANWLQDDSKDLSEDVMIVKAAKERLGDHLKIEMSSWSAPGSLKGSGGLNGYEAGGDSSKASLKKSSSDPYGKYAYSEFAAWWKKSYQKYSELGIAPDYISFQNEPDMFAGYEETLFDPTESDRKAGYAQALNAVYDAFAGVSPRPAILGPEPLGIGYGNFQKYMNALDDSKLDGYAYHLYHANNNSSLQPKDYYLDPESIRSAMSSIGSKYGTGSKPLVMTEFCPMQDDPLESDMVGLAHIMQIGFTEGMLNGYIAWELFYGYHSQMIAICPGKGWDLTGEGKFVCSGKYIKINPEYHAMRHYSKFVNPGWKVVSAKADESALKTVAFKSADGDSVSVIVINTGNAAVNLDAPAFDGYTAVHAVQSVENGEKSSAMKIAASYALPARSITTLVFYNPALSGVRVAPKFASETLQNTNVVVFDLNGNQVWKGLQRNAIAADGSLRLDVRQGMYIVKSKAGIVKAIKK